MTNYPEHNRIYQVDALEFAQSLEPKSVNTVITSPPYFGLRSYLPGKVKLRDDLPDDVRQRVLAELQVLGIEAVKHEE